MSEVSVESYRKQLLAEVDAYGGNWDDFPLDLQQRITIMNNSHGSTPSEVTDLSRLSQLPASPSGLNPAALDRKYRETQHLFPRHPRQQTSTYGYDYDQALRQQQEQQPPPLQPKSEGQAMVDSLRQQAAPPSMPLQPQSEGQAMVESLRQQAASPSTPPSHQGGLRVPGAFSASPVLQRTSLPLRSIESERYVSSPSRNAYSKPLQPFSSPLQSFSSPLQSFSTGPLMHDTYSGPMPPISSGAPRLGPNLGRTSAAVPTTTPENPGNEYRLQRLAEIELEFNEASEQWARHLHAAVDLERSMWSLRAKRDHMRDELRENGGLPAEGRLGAVDLSGTSKKKKKNRPSRKEKKAAEAAKDP